jgi:hypothetical protein
MRIHRIPFALVSACSIFNFLFSVVVRRTLLIHRGSLPYVTRRPWIRPASSPIDADCACLCRRTGRNGGDSGMTGTAGNRCCPWGRTQTPAWPMPESAERGKEGPVKKRSPHTLRKARWALRDYIFSVYGVETHRFNLLPRSFGRPEENRDARVTRNGATHQTTLRSGISPWDLGLGYCPRDITVDMRGLLEAPTVLSLDALATIITESSTHMR